MGLTRNVLLWASRNRWMREHVPRWWFVRGAATRFIPGERLDDAMGAAAALAERGIAAMVTFLGEDVTDREAAGDAVAEYLRAMERIAAAGLDMEPSVKLTQIGLELDPELAAENLERLVAGAALLGSYVWVDMEASRSVAATIEAFRQVRERHDNVGLCVQAYLYRTAVDVDSLLAMGADLRLVKGAYREPPELARQAKSEVDASLAALIDTVLGERTGSRVALASHDVELLAAPTARAEAAGLARGAYEIQMLYGIRVEEQLRLAAEGHRVRVLITYGAGWYPWYLRRLAERPANLLFVLRSLFRRAPRRPRQ